jgi:hypothetical protein
VTIWIEFDDFVGPLAHLNGTSAQFDVGPTDIALAAATVGRPSTAPTSARRLAQMASVAVDVIANLLGGPPLGLGPVGPVTASAEFWDLDATERGAASYRIGMGVAKLVGERVLGVLETCHLSLFTSNPLGFGVAGINGNRRRADLIAEDVQGNWLVIEAKGRSHSGAVHDALLDGKEQAEAVDLTDPFGVVLPVYLRMVTVVDMESNPLTVTANDPEGRRRVRIQGTVDHTRLRETYYSPADDVRIALEEDPQSAVRVGDLVATEIRPGVAIGVRQGSVAAGRLEPGAEHERAPAGGPLEGRRLPRQEARSSLTSDSHGRQFVVSSAPDGSHCSWILVWPAFDAGHP